MYNHEKTLKVKWILSYLVTQTFCHTVFSTPNKIDRVKSRVSLHTTAPLRRSLLYMYTV